MIGTISHRKQLREFRLTGEFRRRAATVRNALLMVAVLLTGGSSVAFAAGNTLQSVDFASLPGNKASEIIRAQYQG